MAYGLDKKKDETIAVYDFGGGTSIFHLEVAKRHRSQVTNGDTHLGGDNLDQRIVEWLIAEFKQEQGLDLAQGQRMACSASAMPPRRRRSSSPPPSRRKSTAFVTADATVPSTWSAS